MNSLRNQYSNAWPIFLVLCAAALVGCAPATENNSSDQNNSAAPKPPTPAATAPDQKPPVPASSVEPPTPPKQASKPGLYSVTIAPDMPTIRTTGQREKTTIAVHNTGPAIPALSLWFDGSGPNCTIQDARSDLSAHPDPVMVDSGQGWDFGPLPHGKTTHITLHLQARTPGVHPLVIKPYAIAEDEGDTERTIDQHIEGADTKLTVLFMVH